MLGARRFSVDDVDEIVKVAFIGSFLPRKCGIATFTHDLHNAVAETFPTIRGVVIAMNDRKDGYTYKQDVRFEVAEQDPSSYLRAADYINSSGVSVMCVQHEYGIYGGECGSMLLPFLKALRIPIVTTLHTILETPSPEQRRIMNSILSISSRVITMAKKGAELLNTVYRADMKKVDIVPHGIPEMEFPDSAKYKQETDLVGKRVVLTFGLLSPNKGIEYAIQAMKPVVEKFPDVVYVVLGQTHPGIIRDHGEMYRHSLEHLASELGIRDNIKFIDSFVDMPLLKKYIASCDLYLTPYLHEAQITSGTLSYAFGMGTVVVSTPYWHAAELLADGRGCLVPFRDSEKMGQALIDLLENDELRNKMKRNAFEFGRTMTWSQTAKLYMKSFEKAKADRATINVEEPFYSTLPDVNLSHMRRMTDDVAIIQHGRFSVPDRDHGYCVDDTSRALLLLTQMRRNGFQFTNDMKNMMTTYIAFMNHAWNRKAGRFRNFMSFDRKWIDQVGSEDSHGRALQCLGACVRFGIHQDCAASLFEESFKAVLDFNSPRAYGFALMGLRDYCIVKSNHEAVAVQKELVDRLVGHYKHNSSKDWKWFEEVATYDNAIIPQACVATGKVLNNAEMISIGEQSLLWLFERQMLGDAFCPIGNGGWFKKDGTRAAFDQQPLEAGGMVLACASAWSATHNEIYRRMARQAFDWFMGKNLIGKPLYDPESNGCCDGLHEDRANLNQGAESLLAFLQALVALKTEERVTKHAQGAGEEPATPSSFTVNVAQFPVTH